MIRLNLLPSKTTHFLPWHGEETAQQPQMCWEVGPSCFPSVFSPLKSTHTITSTFSSGSWFLKLDSCPLPLDTPRFGIIFLKFGAQPLPLNAANLFHFWTISLFQHPLLMFAIFQKDGPLEFPAPFLRNCWQRSIQCPYWVSSEPSWAANFFPLKPEQNFTRKIKWADWKKNISLIACLQ